MRAGISEVLSPLGFVVRAFRIFNVAVPNFGKYEVSLAAESSPTGPRTLTTSEPRRPRIVTFADAFTRLYLPKINADIEGPADFIELRLTQPSVNVISPVKLSKLAVLLTTGILTIGVRAALNIPFEIIF